MKAIFLIIIIFNVLVFGENYTVDTGSNPSQFLINHKNGSIKTFRSGLDDKTLQKKTFCERTSERSMLIDSGYSVDDIVGKWKAGNVNEYIIQNNDMSNEWFSILKGRQKKGCIIDVSFNSTQGEYLVKLTGDKLLSQPLSVLQLLSIADTKLEEYLPFFKKHTEYDYYVAFRKNDTLDGITACYRRIFNHGIVKSNASAVNVQLDAAGNLIRILFNWPSFVPIKNNEVPNSIKITDDLIGLLKAEIDQNYEQISDNGIIHSLTNLEITGITFGWFKTILDNVDVITPCYTFSTNLYYNNGEKISQIISIPILKKYYPDKK